MASIDWKKCKYSEPKRVLRHNDKEMRLLDNHSNPDIDKSKTSRNLEFLGRDYQEECDTLDRLVNGAKSNMKRVRKDAVTMIALNIKFPAALSQPDTPYEVQKEWAQRCFETVATFLEEDGQERVVSGTADFDEIHWYDNAETGERTLSRPEVDIRFVPIIDGKLNGKKYENKPRMHALNNLVERMTQEEFGCKFMTGEEAGLESTDALKAKSLIREAERLESELVTQRNELQSQSDDLDLRIKKYKSAVAVWNSGEESREKTLKEISEWKSGMMERAEILALIREWNDPENEEARNEILDQVESWEAEKAEKEEKLLKLNQQIEELNKEIAQKRKFADKIDAHETVSDSVDDNKKRSRGESAEDELSGINGL